MPELNAKTIDRIHKLLALAQDGGATEAEAELAMTRAQEIMAAHNLTMATLEASGAEREGRVKEASKKSILHVWKRDLLVATAKSNFCFLHLVTGRTKSGERQVQGHEIIGRQSNVIATQRMYQYLLDTIERLVIAEVGTSPQARANRYSHTFRLGCSTRLIERLQERHERMLAEQEKAAREAKARAAHPSAATGSALVVVMRDYAQEEADLNADLANGLAPGTTAARRAAYAARSDASRREREQQHALRLEQAKASGATGREITTMTEYSVSLETARYYIEQWDKPQKVETDKQRQKREEREEREDERYWRKRHRETAHERSVGFQRGRKQADGIGLDTQVENKQARKLS